MANTTGQKFGGRKMGTPNKNNAELKDLLQNIVSDRLKNIVEVLEQLEPKDQLDVIIKLLPYVVPKQKEVAITEQQDQTIKVNIMPIDWVG